MVGAITGPSACAQMASSLLLPELNRFRLPSCERSGTATPEKRQHPWPIAEWAVLGSNQ